MNAALRTYRPLFWAILLWATPALLAPSTASAADPSSVVVDVEPRVVELGERFQYQIRAATRTNHDISLRASPKFGPFRRLATREMPQFININGRAERRLNITYTLQATKKGTFDIGPPTVRIGKRTFEPDPVEVKVVPRGKAPKQNAPRNKKYFILSELQPDRTPYVGEQLLLEYDLYIDARGVDANIHFPHEPDFDAFWIEDLRSASSGRQRMVSMNGRLMQRTSLGTYALFPLRAGPAEIESLQLKLSIGGFFRRTREVTVKSEAIELDVRPLPPDAPPGFYEGNVGEWDFEVRIDRETTRVGRAITVEMVARGDGLVNRLRLPELPEIDGATVSDQEEELDKETRHLQIGGSKTVTYTLMPRKEGELVIPAMTFAYFNPETESYETVRSQKTRIEVGPGELPESVATTSALERRNRSGGDDITKTLLSELRAPLEDVTLRSARPPLHETWWYWLLTALPLAGLLAMVLRGPVTRLRERREPVKRRESGYREAMNRLDAVERDEPRAALQSIAEAVRIYSHETLGVSSGLVTQSELPDVLDEHGFSEDAIAATVDVLGTCDRARFTPEGARDIDVDATVEDARQALRRLEEERGARPGSGGARANVVVLFGIAGLALLIGLPDSVAAKEPRPSDVVDEAVAAQKAGAWEDAAESWKRLHEMLGPNADIAYNLGTAYARSEDYAAARLALERAAFLAPWNGDIDHNLDRVTRIIRLRSIEVSRSGVTMTGDEPLFWWRFIVHATPDLLALVFATAAWLALGAAFFRRRRRDNPAIRDAMTVVLVLTLSTGLLAGGLFIARQQVLDVVEPVILLDDSPHFRDGPSEHASRTRVPTSVVPGILLRVVDGKAEWAKVELPDGTTGWIKDAALGHIERGG